MHAIIVSDSHFGWEDANPDDFKDFVNKEIPSIDPDVLVLNGDILDMWRKGTASVMLDNTDIFDTINNLYRRGVSVVPIVGNHDYRLINSNKTGKVVSEPPWRYVEKFFFMSGDRKFVAIHGHQGDPANAGRVENEALCMTDDETAIRIAQAWKIISRQGRYPGTNLITPLRFSRPNVTALSHVAYPDILSRPENESRVDRITKRLTKAHKPFVIFGHTHVPGVGDNWANCGSWSGENNEYIEVKDGEVNVRGYPDPVDESDLKKSI